MVAVTKAEGVGAHQRFAFKALPSRAIGWWPPSKDRVRPLRERPVVGLAGKAQTDFAEQQCHDRGDSQQSE
ncbi:hypothetical protein CKO40_14075 [Halochromatium glycolicum]|uniref:Uncharacterized protein n=1 Tax=Halochromatium glycolicum TaxID=85075 RepID=A0AAJ0XB83_9GAMM|nr:hypothetical protein [Halochromatium glycolicum]